MITERVNSILLAISIASCSTNPSQEFASGKQNSNRDPADSGAELKMESYLAQATPNSEWPEINTAHLDGKWTKQANRDGGMTSGGDGDNFFLTEKTLKSAWFLGDKPVQYCISKSDNFSVPIAGKDLPETLRSLVRDSLNDWLGTVGELNEMAAEAHSPYRLSKNFKEVKCETGEDLTFYFGVVKDDVRSLLKSANIHPAAFAFVRSYDATLGRTKGYIWISPDSGKYRFHSNGPYDLKDPEDGWWSIKNRTQAILMHELGHVFGVPHTPNTFMDKFTTQLLALPAKIEVVRMTSAIFLSMNWLEVEGRFCAQIWSRQDESNFNIFGNFDKKGNRICLLKSKTSQTIDFKVQSRKSGPAAFNPHLDDLLWSDESAEGTLSKIKAIATSDPMEIYAKPGEKFLSLPRTLTFSALASWRKTDGTNQECPVDIKFASGVDFRVSFKCGLEPVRFDGRSWFPTLR